MIEALNAAGLEPSQAMTGASAANQPQASQNDIRDFAAAMQNTGGAEAAGKPEAAAAVQPGSESSGVGRALLNAFDGLNTGANGIGDAASKIGANGTEFSPSQIIELTMKSHEFMFKSTMTANVANRTSDGIQQLFRQQS